MPTEWKAYALISKANSPPSWMVGAHTAVSPALPHLRARVTLSFGPKQQSMQNQDKLACRQKGQWIRDLVF